MDAETAQRLADLERRLSRLEALPVPGTPKSYLPTVVGLTTAGATTYAEQTGFYVRIGPCIVAQARIRWTGATGTGDAVYGLPVSAGNYTFNAITIYTDGVTFGALTPYAMLQPNTNLFRLFTPVNNGAPTAVAMEAVGEIAFLAVYFP